MSHTLSMPLWQNIDERRSKSALAADLTPLDLNLEEGEASFAGSAGVYSAGLDQCSCMDFHINQNREAPCKHMIRLAMELGLLPSHGKKSDLDAAQYRVALSQANGIAKEGGLLAAVSMAAFLSGLFLSGKSELTDPNGNGTSPLRFFIERSADGVVVKPNKARKKDALSLVKIVEARLGSWVLNSPAALNAALNHYDEE